MDIHETGARFALDMRGLDQLKHKAARDPGEGLRETAEQFEALFLQLMLKSMREATPRSGLMDSQQGQFYDSLMDQQWAQELAGRGVGLADQLTAQLTATLGENPRSSTSAGYQEPRSAADTHGNTVADD